MLFSSNIFLIFASDFSSDAKIRAFSLFFIVDFIFKTKFSIFLLKFSCSIDFNSMIFLALIRLLFFKRDEEFIIG